MAAAVINDVAAWIMLALVVAFAGNGSDGHRHASLLVSVWILISSAVFILVMLTVVRPMMSWLAKQSSSERDTIDDASICLTLTGVMISGFITDLIGIHYIFGAFIFGLTIPKQGGFAAKLIKQMEDLVTNLMLPLYFASTGLKTDVSKIRGAEAWALVVSTASARKILGTFVVAMLCMIPARESLALAILMNTKGLVELIVLNMGWA